MFDESVFPYATSGISVDIPTLWEAITFLSHEPATHDHVCQYDLSYLSTNPPLLGDDATPVQVPSVPPAAALPSPAAAADLASSPVAAAPAAADVAVFPAAAACGVPAPPGSPSLVPDMPEQPESPLAGSPPTPAATPPAAPPGHGMITRLQDNTRHEKKYTDGTARYNPQWRALFAALVSHHDAIRKPVSCNAMSIFGSLSDKYVDPGSSSTRHKYCWQQVDF
jgi:hypothetical protein